MNILLAILDAIRREPDHAPHWLALADPPPLPHERWPAEVPRPA